MYLFITFHFEIIIFYSNWQRKHRQAQYMSHPVSPNCYTLYNSGTIAKLGIDIGKCIQGYI